jgi:hypothetical protein
MKLITYYVALVLLGNAVAAAVCLGIEKVVPWISMPIFLILFFAILWGAWVLAIRWSDPNAKPAAAPSAAADQKA